MEHCLISKENKDLKINIIIIEDLDWVYEYDGMIISLWDL